MTEEEVKNNQEVLRIQEETLNNLKKYNKERNTEIVEESKPRDIKPKETFKVKAHITEVQHPIPGLTEGENSNVYDSLLDDQIREQEEEPHAYYSFCEYCGSMVYQGQLHGLGYCREKVQYEQ